MHTATKQELNIHTDLEDKMPIYKFGYIIKQRREELGYTQEELADGICSVPTLSRIENGERLPTKDNFEMLLQRLGYSESVLYNYVDTNTWFLHEQKFKIRQALILEHFEEAQELLEDYKKRWISNLPWINSSFYFTIS